MNHSSLRCPAGDAARVREAPEEGSEAGAGHHGQRVPLHDPRLPGLRHLRRRRQRVPLQAVPSGELPHVPGQETIPL